MTNETVNKTVSAIKAIAKTSREKSGVAGDSSIASADIENPTTETMGDIARIVMEHNNVEKTPIRPCVRLYRQTQRQRILPEREFTAPRGSSSLSRLKSNL